MPRIFDNTEKNGILDDDADTAVDPCSYACQIWKNATDADPSLAAKIEGPQTPLIANSNQGSMTTAWPKWC